MCSLTQQFGSLHFSSHELKTVPSPDGGITFGYSPLDGGAIGLHWGSEGHRWSFTTFTKNWRKTGPALSQAEFGDPLTGRVVVLRALTRYGMAYPSVYQLVFRNNPQGYQTHVHFCPGYETITGVYWTTALTQ